MSVVRGETRLMTNDQIKLSIQKVIQTLGAPVMDYSPTHANIEREILIDKAVNQLFRLFHEIENEVSQDDDYHPF
jgi:hypothetical protein